MAPKESAVVKRICKPKSNIHLEIIFLQIKKIIPEPQLLGVNLHLDYTPKIHIWNRNNHPIEVRKIIWTNPSIFQVQAVNLPGCQLLSYINFSHRPSFKAWEINENSEVQKFVHVTCGPDFTIGQKCGLKKRNPWTDSHGMNHLTWCWNPANIGINLPYQLVSLPDFWIINSRINGMNDISTYITI